MRAVVQRVKEAFVSVEGNVIGQIEKGLVVFLGVAEGDTMDDVEYIAKKIIGLRVFEDEEGKMNKSLLEVEGELLIISQFTLLGDVRKGFRPSFVQAAKPDEAKKLYEALIQICKGKVKKVEKGQFQAHMLINVLNDGPVTILIDSKKQF